MPSTGFFNNYRLWQVDVTELLAGQTSATLTMGRSAFTRLQVSGTFGGTSVQVQGSNDGGATWINAGAAHVVAGQGTVDVNFDLYRVVLTGGDGTTLIAARFVSRTVA